MFQREKQRQLNKSNILIYQPKNGDVELRIKLKFNMFHFGTGCLNNPVIKIV